MLFCPSALQNDDFPSLTLVWQFGSFVAILKKCPWGLWKAPKCTNQGQERIPHVRISKNAKRNTVISPWKDPLGYNKGLLLVSFSVEGSVRRPYPGYVCQSPGSLWVLNEGRPSVRLSDRVDWLDSCSPPVSKGVPSNEFWGFAISGFEPLRCRYKIERDFV